MHEQIKTYIRAGLHRKYPIDSIISTLVSVGHDRELVRRLAREVITERIHELEAVNVDPMSNAGNIARRAALEVLFGVVMRLVMSAALLLPFSLSLFHYVPA